MSQSISIIDQAYKKWVKELALRYKNSQIKASIKINTEQLKYNWMLGRDIVEMNVEKRWGESVITQLSKDLRNELPGIQGLSKSNIYYCKKFYLLYSSIAVIFQQPVGKNNPAESVPVQQLTNFERNLPAPESGLAQEITKDPYSFAFARITGTYNEKRLKDALLANISKFLIELGTGFAYVGKEYRLQIGEVENFIDLLFYNLKLRCYVVIEVKIEKFDSRDIGQLGTYVTAVNHILREEGKDNPTIGLLICKSKDNTLAQYALESSSQPLGISEYELGKFYPEKVEGTIPTIAEIEATLNGENSKE